MAGEIPTPTPPVVIENSGVVPGTRELTPDEINAAKIAAKNTLLTEAALTSNDIAVDPNSNDGKIYLNGNRTPATDNPKFFKPIPDVSNVGPKGDKGDPGPAGPAGADGAPGADGVVDYDIVQQLINDSIQTDITDAIDDALATQQFYSLRFVQPYSTQIYSGQTSTFLVELYNILDGTTNTVVPQYTLGNPSLGTITPQGVFTASQVFEEAQLTISANYTSQQGKSYTVSTNIAIKPYELVSIAIDGPSAVQTPGAVSFTLMATFSDGSEVDVTTDPNTIWSVSSTSMGIMQGELLIAPAVGQDIIGSINAQYTNGLVVQSDSWPLTLIKAIPPTFIGSASYPVPDESGNINWASFIQSLNESPSTTPLLFEIDILANQYGWFAAPEGMLEDQSYILDGTGGPSGGWGGAMWNQEGAWTGSVGRQVTINFLGENKTYYLWRTDYHSLGKTQWFIF